MKKLIFLSLLALFVLFVVSCTETKPNFQFNLTVTADVDIQKADIFITSVSTVTNDNVGYFPAKDYTSRLSVTEQAPDVNKWIDDYIEKNLIAKLPEKTLYTIGVVGWVRECNTGIMIYVDKSFQNNGVVKTGQFHCRKLII